MGNSHERREQLLQYQPRLINYTLHHTYAPLSIYRHLYSSQQIMEHREIIYHFQDIDRKLQTFHSRYQHLFLVSTQYLKLQTPNACSDGTYQMRTFYQRVITNLSKVNDIPFNDSLYCYSVALKGFEILFRSYGYFQVFENMFHICQQGKLKVWCNQHIYKSVPEQYLLGNGTQQDMVMKVISIIDQNIEQRAHYLNVKEILMRVRPLTFANARSKFLQICNQNQFFVNQYLESLQQTANIETLLDIYAQSPAKNLKSMQPFDTGLTFNPKKTSKTNNPSSYSQDYSVRRPSLKSSRSRNQPLPSQRGGSYDQFNIKNKRIQILNIASANENKQEGFPSFSNKDHKTGRKSSWSQENLKKSSQVYQKIISPMRYENKQEHSHQVAFNSFANPNSPQSRLKKTASRQSGRAPERILFQSNVNEIKEGQIRQAFVPQQNLTNLNRINPQIRQGNQYIQVPITHNHESQRIYYQNPDGMVRPNSQHRIIRESPSLRASQTKTIRVNMSPQFVQQSTQQMSPQWTHQLPKRPLTPQPHMNQQVQPNHLVYPIYPAQKVILQVQPQSSRLKKGTKIQPKITFSQQKSQKSLSNQSQIIFRQTLPNAYVQHEKLAQMLANQRVSQPIPQNTPFKIEKAEFINRNANINIGNISYNTVNNASNHNNQMRILERRQNNHINAGQNNLRRPQNVQFQPNRRAESQPRKIYQIQQIKHTPYTGNLIQTKEILPFRIQKTQNSYYPQKNIKNSENTQITNLQKMKQRQVKKQEKFQLPQIQSKIDMLSSFAENKITTYEFLPNQSHAISGIKWQKGQNSGRDSVSSAFRKELFPQNNSVRQFQKKTSSIEQKNSVPRKQSTFGKGNHDHLQTDPKLLQLIKSATSNYKKELVKTVNSQDKQAAFAQSYNKKDTIKQYNTSQFKYKQSRFKTLPEKSQVISSYGAFKTQSNYPSKFLGKTEVGGAFKKKTQPYITANNKISAISQKWDEENICSTSNGSIGKNYLQNLDADILQDMYAYGMDGGKGKLK